MKNRVLFLIVFIIVLILSACSSFAITSSSREQQTAGIDAVPVTERATGSINGWVWHDQCQSGLDGQPAPTRTPAGCIEDDSALGTYHANGLLDANESPMESIVVKLRAGDCSATSLTESMAEVTTMASDLSYSFTGLNAGTYCVSINPQEEPNFSLLRPGLWTYPYVTESMVATTVNLTPGENKFDVNFGWDHQFK